MHSTIAVNKRTGMDLAGSKRREATLELRFSVFRQRPCEGRVRSRVNIHSVVEMGF